MVNKRVVMFFNCIGPGLVPPDTACDMLGDLGVRQLLWVNNRRVGLDDLQISSFANNRKAGDYLMGPAEEHPCNSFGVFGVGGLADDLAFEIDNCIGPDNEGVAEFLSDVVCLGQGQLFGVFDGRDTFGRESGLIDL